MGKRIHDKVKSGRDEEGNKIVSIDLGSKIKTLNYDLIGVKDDDARLLYLLAISLDKIDDRLDLLDDRLDKIDDALETIING